MKGDPSLADGATILAAIADSRSPNEQYQDFELAKLCWPQLVLPQRDPVGDRGRPRDPHHQQQPPPSPPNSAPCPCPDPRRQRRSGARPRRAPQPSRYAVRGSPEFAGRAPLVPRAGFWHKRD